MVHVYRERPVQRNRVEELVGSAFIAVFMLPLVFGIAHGLRHGFTGDDAGGIFFGLFMGSVFAWCFYDHSRRSCFEIRLSDDGTCEFVTGRRVIRLHVHEITAVKYSNDVESGESYAVRYRGGRIGLRSSISDLRGFVTRLQAVNPAVDLSSFPDSWRRPAGFHPGPPRRPSRWAVPLALIGLLGCVLCLLVLVGVATGLLPGRFIWLFLVGMVATGGFVYAVNSDRPGQPQKLAEIGWELADERLRVEREPARRALLAAPVLVVAAIGVLLIIAINKAEPVNRYPTPSDAASKHVFTRPLLTETSGVWLVPLGEPRRVDLTRLAAELAARYRTRVALLPDIALPRWTLDAKKRSLVGDQLIRLLGQAYRVQGRAAIIGITDFEMYGGAEFRDSVFSWRESARHYGVVSTSPLGADPFDLPWRGHRRYVRTRKLVERNIGFLYYRRAEVDDSHSLLRPSMSGVDDIDKLTEAL